MAAKSNKNMIIGIAVAAVVVVAVIVGVVLMNKKNGGTESGGNGGSSSKVDYSDVDVSVEFGDYDTMYAQAKAIQNGEMTGKIIEIDGLVSHPMSKYSVVEPSGSGEKIGTEFEIEGMSEEDYPNDGDRIVIAGEVVEKSPLYFIIKTTPDYVSVVDSDELPE